MRANLELASYALHGDGHRAIIITCILGGLLVWEVFFLWPLVDVQQFLVMYLVNQAAAAAACPDCENAEEKKRKKEKEKKTQHAVGGGCNVHTGRVNNLTLKQGR